MRAQTSREEAWNAGTHAFGFVASIIGLVLLLQESQIFTQPEKTSIWIYGCSLMLLYAASTTYHIIDATKHLKLKHRLRQLDHISIYYLIAGTYTPVLIFNLPVEGNWLLWSIWGIAAFGTILKIFFTGRFEWFSSLLYLVMGWMVIFEYSNLLTTIDSPLYLWIGGAFYTVGVVFYLLDKYKYAHVAWHFFVLAGSFFHWLFIWEEVLGR